MEYRDTEYQILQTANPTGWKWTVLFSGQDIRTGSGDPEQQTEEDHQAAGTAARSKEGLQKADAESRPGPLSYPNTADLGQGISSIRHFLWTVSRRCYLALAR
jgi:hypothetical protein